MFLTPKELCQRMAKNDPEITNVSVTPDNVSRVAAAIQGNTHIKYIHVHIGAEAHRNEPPADDMPTDWKDFCRAAQALPSLKTVYVYMRHDEASDEDCILLGLLLQSTKQINNLSLAGYHNRGCTLCSLAVCRLAYSLKELTGLESITLSHFGIQPTDLSPLHSALSSLPKLKYLSLKPQPQCQRPPLPMASMLDDAFFYLERLLRKQSLYEFSYYKNVAFSDAQAEAVMDIMSRRFDIVDFYFIDQFWGTQSRNLTGKIMVIKKLNKAGRRYLTESGSECKAAGIKVLSKVSDDLDCLYYHLRENPALMSNIVEKSLNKKRKK